MNKDKLLMVVLIIATLAFFNSPVWHKMGSKIKEAPEKSEITQVTDSGETIEPLLTADKQEPAAVPTLMGESVEEEPVVDTIVNNDSTLEVTESTPSAVCDTTVIENNLLRLEIAGDGARIISAQLKEYKYAEKVDSVQGLVELVENREKGIAATAITNNSLNKVIFEYKGEDAGRYTFTGVYKGKAVTKVFSVTEDSYIVGYEVQSALLTGTNSTILFSSSLIESESVDGRGLRYSPLQLSVHEDSKVDKVKFKKNEQIRNSGKYDWVASTSRYFAIVALPSVQQSTDLDMLSAKIDNDDKPKADNLKFSFALTAPAVGDKANYDIYLGPTKNSELKKIQAGLEKTVFRGYGWFFGANLWFPKLCDLVLFLINTFSVVFRDYGIAIILITLILRLITFPLTQSSMKSMSKMKDIQPQLQAIQAKHKSNPQLMQAKLMEFYKEEGVSPLSGLGGCIPMFLQMPIMISLFVVLRKAVELRGQSTFLLPWVNDLSQKEALFNLPFTIPVANIDTFAVLPFLMAILMFFQNKMTMGANGAASQDPNQRMMIYMMPVMMFFMFYNMPAGLTLYFTFSSVLQIVQQHFVNKKKSAVTVVK